jgi:tetratricopeptide (TPR) repeat protein
MRFRRVRQPDRDRGQSLPQGQSASDLLKAAEAAFESGQYAGARSLFEQASIELGSLPPIVKGIAVATAIDGKYSAACAGFDELLEQAPSALDPFTALIAIQAYVHNAQPARALRVIEVMPPIPADYNPVLFPLFASQAALALGKVRLAAELLTEELLSGRDESQALDQARKLRLEILARIAAAGEEDPPPPTTCTNCGAPRFPGRVSCLYCRAAYQL